ncbi:MAG: TIGR03619 family F420-dependent LLM class oxidoreductase [Frankia sp.]|nr:TIGR03619 family F420-dependent LLM class oxidoreductase [Frankia sp.]
MAGPHLTLALPTFSADDPGGWQHLRDRARAADEAGFDRVVCSDHVVFGENLDAYGNPKIGGSAGGRQPTGPDGHWLDPLTTLTWIAGFTERVRLGTNILLAALRRPVVLAKTLATLDVLSGGRVDVGVGVGWQREEYEAAGLSFEGRGALLDHTLAVCQTLWREQRASYSDEFLTFEAIHQMPKPLQPGGVPIWVSGTVNKPAARRIARFGSGWIPWGPAAADLPTWLPRLKELVAEAGGDPTELQVAAQLPMVRENGRFNVAATMERAAELAAVGVTDFRGAVPVPDDPAGQVDALRAAVEAFRAATAGITTTAG